MQVIVLAGEQDIFDPGVPVEGAASVDRGELLADDTRWACVHVGVSGRVQSRLFGWVEGSGGGMAMKG